MLGGQSHYYDILPFDFRSKYPLVNLTLHIFLDIGTNALLIPIGLRRWFYGPCACETCLHDSGVYGYHEGINHDLIL